MNIQDFQKKGYCGLIHTLDKDEKRTKKYIKQHETDMMDDTETWGLDTTICKFMYSRLTRFYELADKTILIDDEHREIIKKMIEGFKIGVEDDFDEDMEKFEKLKLAFKLLAENFRFLWW